MLEIKPGMTTGTLYTIFTTEGGLSTRLRQTFVSRDCPYFKGVVDFQAVGDAERGDLVEDLRDVYSHDLAAVFAIHFLPIIYEPSYAKSSGWGEARSAALPHPAFQGPAERLANQRSPGPLNSASGSDGARLVNSHSASRRGR